MLRMIRLILMSATFLAIAISIVYFQLEKPLITRDAVDDVVDLGGPFDLIDQHGKACRNTDFQGKFMIVYFGYSYCPDACPLALQNISKALKSLQKDRDQIVPIFITLDPKRDDINQLKAYSENYDPNFYFLTGRKEAIDSVAKAYKTFAKEIKDAGTTEYLVDHSTLIYLMDRKGKLISFFPHTIDPEKLTNVLVQMLSGEHKAVNKSSPHDDSKKA